MHSALKSCITSIKESGQNLVMQSDTLTISFDLNFDCMLMHPYKVSIFENECIICIYIVYSKIDIKLSTAVAYRKSQTIIVNISKAYLQCLQCLVFYTFEWSWMPSHFILVLP